MSAIREPAQQAESWNANLAPALKLFSGLAAPIISIGLFLGLWEVLAAVFDVPLWLLPRPSDFLWGIVTNFAEIWHHGLTTAKVLFFGFLLGVLVSVPLGLLIVSFGFLERGLYPVMVFLNIMPKTIIGPIMIVWFGIGPLVSVLIVFLMSFFPILVDCMSGFRSIDKRLYYITRSMGATPWQTFRYIRVQAALPYIFAGMRIGIVTAAEGAIVAEFIGSDEGLGYLIMYAASLMNISLMFSTIVAASILAIFFNSVVVASEKVLMPWAPANRT